MTGVAAPGGDRLAMGLEGHGLGQPVRPVEGGGPPGEAGQQVVQLRPEPRVVADLVVGRLEALERTHQRLGDVSPAEVALLPPPAGRVNLEQPRVDRGGTERGVWPVATRVPGPLGEQGDAHRVLARTLAGCAGCLRPGRDVHADGGHREHGLADVRRVEAAGQGDRDLAGHGGGEGRVDADPGAARVGPAGRVEQDPGRAGGQERPRGAHHLVRDGARGHAQRLGNGSADGGDGRRRLVAVELDLVGIHGGDRHGPARLPAGWR